MKHLILIAALALLPAVALAQDASAPAPDAAAAPAPDATAAPAALPKCSAKVTDSCQQTKAQQASALDHYPADTRDAGNNKIGAPAASAPVAHKKHKHAVKTTTATTTTETPVQ